MDHFAGSGLEPIDCVLYFKTKIAGSVKRIMDKMMTITVILSYTVSLYGLVFFSLEVFFFSLMTQIFFGLLGVKRDGMVRVRTRLVSRIKSGPRLVGRVGSEVRVSDSFHILAVRS